MSDLFLNSGFFHMANTVSRDTAQTMSSGGGESLPENYEAAVAELEELVARMEGGALSLEQSLSAYRRGAALVAFCQQQLEKVEHQVRVLDGETLKPLPAHAAPADRGDDL
jgi:exodeoxyribonuclease VII small subunit